MRHTLTSREIAKQTGKRHALVMRNIEAVLRADPELKSQVTLVHGKNSYGGVQSFYVIGPDAVEIMLSKLTLLF